MTLILSKTFDQSLFWFIFTLSSTVKQISNQWDGKRLCCLRLLRRNKKRVCRVLAMVKEGMLTFSHGKKDLIWSEEPLKGLQKRGRLRALNVRRPPKLPKQFRFVKLSDT